MTECFVRSIMARLNCLNSEFPEVVMDQLFLGVPLWNGYRHPFDIAYNVWSALQIFTGILLVLVLHFWYVLLLHQAVCIGWQAFWNVRLQQK